MDETPRENKGGSCLEVRNPNSFSKKVTFSAHNWPGKAHSKKSLVAWIWAQRYGVANEPEESSL